MRKASGLKPSCVAKLAAMGAITSTVAALLRNGVTAIAATMMSTRAPVGGSMLAADESQPAIRSVPPVVRIDSLTGINAPSMTMIGHSMVS